MRDAGNVVDPNKETDPADPYVLALALQLQDQGNSVRVVTEDWKDRPPLKISMITASATLSVPCVRLQDFLAAIGVAGRPPTS